MENGHERRRGTVERIDRVVARVMDRLVKECGGGAALRENPPPPISATTGEEPKTRSADCVDCPLKSPASDG